MRRPDACWMPEEQWNAAQYADPFPFAPDIRAEVLSRRNTQAEISMKTAAYLDSGAKEVVIVGIRGEVDYFGTEGKRDKSAFLVCTSVFRPSCSPGCGRRIEPGRW